MFLNETDNNVTRMAMLCASPLAKCHRKKLPKNTTKLSQTSHLIDYVMHMNIISHRSHALGM